MKPLPENLQPPEGCVILGYGGTFEVPNGGFRGSVYEPDNQYWDSWDGGIFLIALRSRIYAAPLGSEVVIMNSMKSFPEFLYEQQSQETFEEAEYREEIRKHTNGVTDSRTISGVSREDFEEAHGSPSLRYTGHTRCPKCNQVHWMHGECPSEIEQPAKGESKTPITDHFYRPAEGNDILFKGPSATFARQLETALAESRAEVEDYNRLALDHERQSQEIERLNEALRLIADRSAELTALREENTRLREWQPITDKTHRKMILAVAINPPGVKGRYTTDPWAIWWDEKSDEWVRWPHAFPPSHYSEIPTAPMEAGKEEGV